ncbi:SGNH/GDSL hydrolase family protein [Apibacter raozihei]|uniref:SGNH/GDSL hydrolase family protein n=1 Tax=Apibacter raozihei TaxID=2500547 RepID=UPI000FE3F257|nr:SGNH/GDSL hydrolase family protein [Apibacter raozihei]
MKKRIYKYKIISLLFVVSVLFISIYSYYEYRFHFSENLYDKDFFNPKKGTDKILKIGIIGDSWVEYGSLDSIIQSKFKQKNIKSHIIASGQQGATTREIYQNLYKSKNDIYSSKKVIDQHPRYCIIISGVNDTNKQMGKKYYAYHLKLIIETLMKEGIIPIVVSIPHYGIIEEYEQFSKLKQLRFKIFAMLNNKGNLDNIDDYNEYFNNSLEKNLYKDSMFYFNINAVVPNYKNNLNLFNDHLHLNLQGKEILGINLINQIEILEQTDFR